MTASMCVCMGLENSKARMRACVRGRGPNRLLAKWEQSSITIPPGFKFIATPPLGSFLTIERWSQAVDPGFVVMQRMKSTYSRTTKSPKRSTRHELMPPLLFCRVRYTAAAFARLRGLPGSSSASSFSASAVCCPSRLFLGISRVCHRVSFMAAFFGRTQLTRMLAATMVTSKQPIAVSSNCVIRTPRPAAGSRIQSAQRRLCLSRSCLLL